MKKIALLFRMFLMLQGFATIQAGTTTPDLPLEPSSEAIEAEINTIFNKYSDNVLGVSAPSASSLASAVTKYNDLNIVVSNGTITGNVVSSYDNVAFIKTFAQQLKFNPTDSESLERARNLVWWVSKQVVDGKVKDPNFYAYRNFAKPAACLGKFYTEPIKELFLTSFSQVGGINHFWAPVYDAAYQKANGTISTDLIYNIGDAIMACVCFEETPEGRYRYMRAFKRFMDRFCSYTVGTNDGLKLDGTGFHHNAAYDGYMYAYSTAASVISYLTGTTFQTSKDGYLLLRDVVYAQIMYCNDAFIKSLSMSGRHPDSRGTTLGSSTISQLAIAGGKILGLSTADPVLAGEYNRLFGSNSNFNYTTYASTSESSGFYQFNHTNAGVFRKESSWLAVAKGLSNGLWGTETYATNNRYGRYQSYGTLEIIYPGNATQGNGFDHNSWNWNFNPGATTIVLPWSMLHSEHERLDEYQQKDFAGSLAFKNKNGEALKKTHGTYGLFAMDFQQKTGLGWGIAYGPDTHNASFKFKKSAFFFDDMIVCLGSDITNNDATHPTITTLFQCQDNTGVNIFLNGRTKRVTDSIQCATDNWVLSNFGTGYYVVANSGNYLHCFVGEQRSPHEDSTDPSTYLNNPAAAYKTIYLNHGKNPSNASYEYVTIPQSTTTTMAALDASYKTDGKPYTVHQQDANAHIVEHNSQVWGYAVFAANAALDASGLVSNVSYPSLLMYEQDKANNKLLLALTNPSLGLSAGTYLSYKPIAVTLKGLWEMQGENPNVTIAQNEASTVVTFQTKDGLPEEITLLQTGSSTQVLDQVADHYEIYPNPVSDTFQLKGLLSEKCEWRLSNVVGQIMKQGTLQTALASVDVSSLMPGVYFFNLVNGRKSLFKSKVLVR